jgi:hypothetical protein
VGKFFDASLFSSKTALQAAILLILALGAAAVARQMHQVTTAASDPGQIITIPAGPAPAASEIPESLAPAEDSLDSAAAEQTLNTSNTSSSLTVNGQDIPLPQNGQVNQTLSDGGTTTTVNASSSSSGGGNTNHSSLNINVHSRSVSTSRSSQ